MLSYAEAWAFLDNLQFFKIKLGLDSMRHFLGLLGNPEKKLRFVHVAGTNGKGSVSATLRTVLSAAGFRTGLYTSPHLDCVRERFRIDEDFISEAEFARHAAAIIAVLGERQITYFEFTTALALLWFAEREVDVVILEVGLGGRLDATNVIAPLVSVITNIAMDHEAYLGTTLAEVASEKAGIVKPGVPVVSAARGREVLDVLKGTAARQGAPFLLLGRDFAAETAEDGSLRYRGLDGRELAGLRLNLAGGFQGENTAVALAALEILEGRGFPVSEEALRSGLARVAWPGRLERVETRGRSWLLDGAHNPAGVEALGETLAGLPRRRLVVVWAAMADKDLASTTARIAPAADVLILTNPATERAARPEKLLAAVPAALRDKARCVPGVAAALDEAVRLSSAEDLLCVAGSLYLIGEARKLLVGPVVGGGRKP